MNRSEAENSLNNVNELKRAALRKATPPGWYSFYWAVYVWFIFALPTLGANYGLLLFPALISVSVVEHRMKKNGVRLSMIGRPGRGVVFHLIIALAAITLYLFVRWISKFYGLSSLPFIAGVISALFVFFWLELNRLKLIKLMEGFSSSG